MLIIESFYPASLGDRVADVLDEDLEVERVGWRGFELAASVEGPGVLVDGVDEQDADTEFVGGGKRAEHGVAQQPRADAASLHAGVDGEACEQRGGDGVARHALCRAPRRVGVGDGGGCQGVVADDAGLFGVGNHEGPRGTDGRGLQVVPGDPGVQRLDAAVERLDVVVDGKYFGVAEAQHLFGACAAHRLDHGGLDLGGPLECVVEHLPRLGISANSVRSARTTSARLRPLSTRNSDTDSPTCAAARRDSSSSLGETRRLRRAVLVTVAMGRTLPRCTYIVCTSRRFVIGRLRLVLEHCPAVS